MDILEVKVTKRGRKPKSHIIPVLKTIPYNTDTPIIAHLPINYSDVIDNTIDNSDSIFIKSEFNNTNDKEIKMLKNKIEELNNKLIKYEKTTKPCVHSLINTTSKCWWDKHSYSSPTVELPEHYFNGIYHAIGFFCSYNCAMAYNIDLNDENISKRNSLLHFHYKNTYNVDIVIKPAASWKILKEYGGSVDIKEFRDNLISNKNNYIYIKPPFISRISYVEKVPVNEEIEIIKPNEFVLKRTKPLNSNKYSLETTIGLKKIINTS